VINTYFNLEMEEKRCNPKAMKVLSFISVCFLFIVFTTIQSISAATPFTSSTINGLQFAYSPYDTVKANEDFELHVHVINDTATQTNATTTCFIHLYSPSGIHTATTNLVWDTNTNREFEATLLAGNFTTGNHAYIIQCNNTNKQQGMESSMFSVTNTGSVDNSNFFWIILFISIGAIILGLAIKNAPITILGSMAGTFLGLYIIKYGIIGLKDNVYTWVMGITLLFICLYIMIKSSYEMIMDEGGY